MNLQTECDVLIVGAGPAGSSAAKAAASSGASVVMIDKRSEIGRPVQCAEHIPRALAMEVPFSREAIAQEVLGTETYIEWEKKVVTDAPGWILNREVFDRELAGAAVESGAKFFPLTRAVDRTTHGVRVSHEGEKKEIACKVIVGADGPASTVGEWAGQRNEQFINAIQTTFPLAEPLQYCQVHFTREFEGGYGWVFPRGECANVGIGVVQGRSNLKELLDGFLGRLRDDRVVCGEEIRSTAGLIPVGGPLETVAGDTLLVGDAAGHTHPVSGAGIPQAVVCGKMAGRAAARAALADDLTVLPGYKEEWTSLYGSALQMARKRREEMERYWKARDFTALIKRSWIAYKDYYRTA